MKPIQALCQKNGVLCQENGVLFHTEGILCQQKKVRGLVTQICNVHSHVYAVGYGVIRRVAVCCSVLQCVAVTAPTYIF